MCCAIAAHVLSPNKPPARGLFIVDMLEIYPLFLNDNDYQPYLVRQAIDLSF